MRARADEQGQLTGGASSAAREKGETACAAGVGAPGSSAELSGPPARPGRAGCGAVGCVGEAAGRALARDRPKQGECGWAASRPSGAGRKEGKEGDAGPSVSLAGLKWKRGRFLKKMKFFSIFSFQILSQNQIKFKYVLNILFISNINEQFW